MQAVSRGADRFASSLHAAEIQPRHSFGTDFDHGGEVIKRGRDQLADSLDCFWIGKDESRLGTKMLCLAQRHAGHDAKRLRFLRRGDDVLVPKPDDDWRTVKIRPTRQLEMSY